MRRATSRRGVVAILVAISVLAGLRQGAAREEERQERKVSFARDIRPILTARCLSCHNGTRMSGGLRLDQRKSAVRDSILIPGQARESRLYQRITATDGEAMPPTGERLTAEQIELIRDWIDAGAEWPEDPAAASAGPRHWA